MRGKVLVDLRNVYDRAEAERAGLTYFGIGRGGARAVRGRPSAIISLTQQTDYPSP